MEQELVFNVDGKALTNSLLVAEKFGKNHKHVLESIRGIIKGYAEISADPMFEETTYVNEQNKQEYPMFIMNRDGFTLLVMGFTGKKAMQFKVDYISAFNKMEKMIADGLKQVSSSTPKTNAEMLLMFAQQMVDQERRVSSIEGRLETIEKERDENGRLLLSATLSNDVIPQMTVRSQINQLARQFSVANNIAYNDVWHKVYNQLYYLYHISVKQYKKSARESYLDVAERNGFLDKIYAILSNMIRENA